MGAGRARDLDPLEVDDEGVQRVRNDDSEQQRYKKGLRQGESANDRDRRKYLERDATRVDRHGDRRADDFRRGRR